MLEKKVERPRVPNLALVGICRCPKNFAPKPTTLVHGKKEVAQPIELICLLCEPSTRRFERSTLSTAMVRDIDALQTCRCPT
eukprot:SAG31_NODE_499_length_14841_cov_7.930471_2_plen_82_part_00